MQLLQITFTQIAKHPILSSSVNCTLGRAITPTHTHINNRSTGWSHPNLVTIFNNANGMRIIFCKYVKFVFDIFSYIIPRHDAHHGSSCCGFGLKLAATRLQLELPAQTSRKFQLSQGSLENTAASRGGTVTTFGLWQIKFILGLKNVMGKTV